MGKAPPGWGIGVGLEASAMTENKIKKIILADNALPHKCVYALRHARIPSFWAYPPPLRDGSNSRVFNEDMRGDFGLKE